VSGVGQALGTYNTCVDTSTQLTKIEAALAEMRSIRKIIEDTGHPAWLNAVVAVGKDDMCPSVPVHFCNKMNFNGQQLCIVSGVSCVKA